MPSPLTGVRVLDLSRLIPGPYCSLVLSDLGAEVIKVEDTGQGDYLRAFPPLRGAMGGAFYALNRGKRSLSIDLKQDRGRELLLQLLPRFDVVIESFRPGVLQRLGLGYDTLAATHPSVILCSISGYGQDGPLRDRAGHDIDYLAIGGVLDTIGRAGERPVVPGIQIADIAGGALWAAVRILAALHAKRGEHIDVSMTEGAMAFLLPWFGERSFGGDPVSAGESLLAGGVARYDTYETADKRHLAVGALEPKFWSTLCQTLGRTADASDLVSPPERQRELRRELQAELHSRDRDSWEAELGQLDTCVAPVIGLDELPEHPQHRHRGMFFEVDDDERGSPQQMRLPLSTAGASTPAPRKGEHSIEIVREELGLGEDAIQTLLDSSVVVQS